MIIDEFTGYWSSVKLLRYGHYFQDDEDRLVNSYFSTFPEKEIVSTTIEHEEFEFDPRNEMEADIRLCIRHGFFLRVIATTEVALKELCDCAQRRKTIQIAVDALRGDSPRKYRIYLEKLSSVDFTELDSLWKTLETLFLIRHCWAHADGTMNSNQKSKIKEFCSATNLASISKDEDTVIITPELLHDASETCLVIVTEIKNQLLA